ncbi:MAG TPA: hypothetical protein VKB38_07940 [Terracidiphilus sp.]|nr:hypothetical protein [Terracidiphilus sp.]
MARIPPRPAIAMCAGLLLTFIPSPAFAGSKKAEAQVRPPLRATLQPSFTIPAEPLGFSAPGAFYLGMRNSLVSLDFLDENRLLFTFRVPGLLRRAEDRRETDGEREIRAVVLRLPGGAVESETVWTVHDRARYLYMLDSGQFLLRDRNNLFLVDAALEPKPYLKFPGPVLWVEVDPSRQFLVTGSSEPSTRKPAAGEVPAPATAAASVTTDDEDALEGNLVLRILRRSDGKVMLVSHIHGVVHVPINPEGYLESLRGSGKQWTLNFDHFSGGNTILGSVDSVCTPLLDFASSNEVLATTCGSSGDPRLVALSLSGKRLWENSSVPQSIWPKLVFNANGLRLARETLLASHDVNAANPLDTDDIKGQDVQIIDAATGHVALRAAASPVFDAGGNVAISPSGRRVAIIMNNDIQVFDLPEPPQLADGVDVKASR